MLSWDTVGRLLEEMPSTAEEAVYRREEEAVKVMQAENRWKGYMSFFCSNHGRSGVMSIKKVGMCIGNLQI